VVAAARSGHVTQLPPWRRNCVTLARTFETIGGATPARRQPHACAARTIRSTPSQWRPSRNSPWRASGRIDTETDGLNAK